MTGSSGSADMAAQLRAAQARPAGAIRTASAGDADAVAEPSPVPYAGPPRLDVIDGGASTGAGGASAGDGGGGDGDGGGGDRSGSGASAGPSVRDRVRARSGGRGSDGEEDDAEYRPRSFSDSDVWRRKGRLLAFTSPVQKVTLVQARSDMQIRRALLQKLNVAPKPKPAPAQSPRARSSSSRSTRISAAMVAALEAEAGAKPYDDADASGSDGDEFLIPGASVPELSDVGGASSRGAAGAAGEAGDGDGAAASAGGVGDIDVSSGLPLVRSQSASSLRPKPLSGRSKSQAYKLAVQKRLVKDSSAMRRSLIMRLQTPGGPGGPPGPQTEEERERIAQVAARREERRKRREHEKKEREAREAESGAGGGAAASATTTAGGDGSASGGEHSAGGSRRRGRTRRDGSGRGASKSPSARADSPGKADGVGGGSDEEDDDALALSGAAREQRRQRVAELRKIQDLGGIDSDDERWVNSSRVSLCQQCEQAFTVLNRKHHCRACGQVVCQTCSPYKVMLKALDAVVRVCRECNALLLGTIWDHKPDTEAFFDAVHRGDLLEIEARLDDGQDMNARDRLSGETALHVAARAGQGDVARLLLREGAIVDLPTTDGRTPLHYCAMSGQEAAAGPLLRSGGSADVEDLNGDTPRDVAVKRGHKKVLAKFKQHEGAAPPVNAMVFTQSPGRDSRKVVMPQYRIRQIEGDLSVLEPAGKALQLNLRAVLDEEWRWCSERQWQREVVLGQNTRERFEAAGMIPTVDRYATQEAEAYIVGNAWNVGHLYGADVDLADAVHAVSQGIKLADWLAAGYEDDDARSATESDDDDGDSGVGGSGRE